MTRIKIWRRSSKDGSTTTEVVRDERAPPSEVAPVEATSDVVPAATELPVSLHPGVDPILVSNFTHQIINPLNGIVGTIDNIIDGSIPDNKRLQRLKAVREQLSHSIELVRNLAYLSQLSTDAGRTSLQAKATDVSLPETVIEALSFFQETGARTGIKISLTDGVTQYAVPGVKDLLRQVFINIFENAVKYATPDSSVTIDIREHRKTGALLVEVSNFGPGFRATEKERLFDLGFRGADAQDAKASGSGLGLYICREILLTHNATIEAEHSNTTRKTIFRIRFPKWRLDVNRTREFRNEQRFI